MAKSKEQKQEYLLKIFQIMKRRDSIVITDKKTQFKSTEIRLISELLAAKYQGRRMISSQLARALGVTRSAVSQIVGQMEKDGLVIRVPAETDKKIAYVELTDAALKTYSKDITTCMDFVGSLVEKFGEDKFNQLCVLFDEFIDLAEKKIKK